MNLSQDNINYVLKHLQSMRPKEWDRLQQKMQRLTKQYTFAFQDPTSKDMLHKYNEIPQTKWKHYFIDTPRYNQLRDINQKLDNLTASQFTQFLNTGLSKAVKSTESKYPNTIIKNAKANNCSNVTYNNNKPIPNHNVKIQEQKKIKHNSVNIKKNKSVNDTKLTNDDICSVKYLLFEYLMYLTVSISTEEFNYFVKMLLKAINQF